MNILIVEDGNEKVGELNKLLSSFECIVKVVADSNSALDLLTEARFDIVIMDICIPYSIHEDTPSCEKGKELLYQIKSDDEIIKPYYVLGLTALEGKELEGIIKSFDEEAWDVIHFDSVVGSWKEKLRTIIEYYSKIRSKVYCDIFVVCALKDSEEKAVCNSLTNLKRIKIKGLPYNFYCGDFEYNSKKYKVITCSQSKMGSVATSILLSNCIGAISPRAIGMSGILAGIKSELNYGDIVIAEQAWDWNSGKFTEIDKNVPVFEPDPDPVHFSGGTSDTLFQFIEDMNEEGELTKCYKDWNGNKPSTILKIKPGFIASGASVVNSKTMLENIKKQKRKYIALEMEVYGLYKSFTSFGLKNTPCIAFKSVADFGDGTKNDLYHHYASYTSSYFLLRYLSRKLDG